MAAGLGLIAALIAANRVTAEPAHFWISTSSSSPQGPEAPTIPTAGSAIQQLYIWAQPETFFNGPYHSVDNPFNVLQNFSLNLVTFQPEVHVLDLDDEIVVYNPQLNPTTKRFQYINDSTNGLTLTPEEWRTTEDPPDNLYPIRGIQGFSISSNGVTGIGPTCYANDPYCEMTPDGAPAWLVASVSFRMDQISEPAEFYLQIGFNGMSHFGESSSATSVVFGAGSSPGYTAPEYIAGNYSGHPYGDRETTHPDDTPDLIIQPFLAGDFNRDGSVDAADYVAWRKGLGTIYTPADFDVWRMHFGETSGSGAESGTTTVPEPNISLLTLIGLWLLVRQRRDSPRQLAVVH